MTDLKTIRTDVVGSLLRPAALKEARVRFDEGKISAAELAAIEDDAVRGAVRLQEGAGLDVVSDGEMRRLNFQDSFGASVEGYDAERSTLKVYERRVEGSAPLQRWDIPKIQRAGTAVSHRRPAKARLRLGHNVPLEEYRFVGKMAKVPAKVSLIGPDRISQRFDYQASTAVYQDMDEFLADVVAIERTIVQSLVDAGCRYIHIDAPGFTAYVDEPSLAQMRERGEDPTVNFARSLKAEGAVVEGFPGVAFGIHLCRGNQRSMWHREGSYDAIAERMFTELPHDRFLLEYDSPRAGGFAPLRFVPKGKVIVLGLISTKVPELEKIDALKQRIDEAAKHIPLDQLAISPQCGFASDVVGNLLSDDDQKRKLELVTETARQVWGMKATGEGGMRRQAQAALVLLALAVGPIPAGGQSVAEFYAGKQLNLIVGATPGGGYDTQARLVARHLGRHVPGNPTIIVQNMPAAGSLAATNHIYNVAARDGTVIALVMRGMLLIKHWNPASVRFDLDKLNWIGSVNSEVAVTAAWHTTPFKTARDLFTQELIVGGTAGVDPETTPRLFNALLSTKFRIINGYPGTTEIILAMERGELQGIGDWSWSSMKTQRPDWIRDKKITLLMQAALQKEPELGDLPSVLDFVKNDADRKVMELYLTQKTVARPVIAPPGVPADRMAALRAAFMALAKDDEFLADAQKAKLEVAPVAGETVDKVIALIAATSPETAERLGKAIAPPEK